MGPTESVVIENLMLKKCRYTIEFYFTKTKIAKKADRRKIVVIANLTLFGVSYMESQLYVECALGKSLPQTSLHPRHILMSHIKSADAGGGNLAILL